MPISNSHRPHLNAQASTSTWMASYKLAHPEILLSSDSRKRKRREMACKQQQQAWWRCVAVLMTLVAASAQDAMQSKCQADLGKLTDCMDYATGHAGSPSSTCCGDTSATQMARPECLCYIIQQVHNGTHGVQSLGLRFDRLLALPGACKLPNANVSLCINLLHLTPTSPDYALFANASKITPSTATPASDSTADGIKVQTGLSYSVTAAVLSAVLSSIF